ncbi:MAG: VCBS repeat-containing protein, partial [Chitinophagales bacterium]|nr:VCBS repeat-containing protein [Chitinophagales bacterium]
MKTLFPFVLLVLLFQSAHSQSPKYRVLNVPVERNTIQLRQPWVGGMNSPQFSPIDLNCDNRKDLFVFDRVGSKVLTYINNGSNNDSAFTYAPAYEKLFPDMTAWALIHDYNEDGIPDIFAHANSGTMVFKGSLQNGQLRFDTVSSLLLYYEPPYITNIYTAITDLPVFVDVNFDGDIDVLTYTVLGGQVEYYENQHKEHPGDIHYA